MHGCILLSQMENALGELEVSNPTVAAELYPSNIIEDTTHYPAYDISE